MKHETVRRYISVEQHFVSLTLKDLASLLSTDEKVLDPRDLYIHVTQGEKADKIIAAEEILMAARAAMNEKDEEGEEVGEGIPPDAEVTIAIGWRREVEVSPNQIPTRMHAPSPITAGLPATAPVFNPADVGAHANCKTCGAVPDLQGPTPDCQDPHGCARVRAHRGELPIPQATTEAPAPQIGTGGILPGVISGMHGTQKLTNRETGEQVFAGKDGLPYGVGYDYAR